METTYEKELFRQIRESVQTPEDLFARLAELRILDETRMRALAVREWIKQQNPVLIHGRPKKGICRYTKILVLLYRREFLMFRHMKKLLYLSLLAAVILAACELNKNKPGKIVSDRVPFVYAT